MLKTILSNTSYLNLLFQRLELVGLLNKKVKIGPLVFTIVGAVYLVIIFCFIFFVSNVIDPDFGFRLRTGGLILDSGFPETDPYSYTMPSFPYVEHAWLIAVFWSLIYPIGYSLLVFISVLSIMASVVISAKRALRDSSARKMIESIYPTKEVLWFVSSPVFILSISAIVPFVGVRAQVYSWLIFSAFVYLFFIEKKWTKFRYFIPLFILVWVNMHGSFAYGLMTISIIVLGRFLGKKKIDMIDILVLFASVIITYLNPYGLGVWREILLTTFDSSIKFRINEWRPAVFMFNPAFFLLVVISLIGVFKYREKYKIEEMLMYLFTLFMALLSGRHIVFWVIFCIPLTIRCISYFFESLKGGKGVKERFKIAYNVLLVFSIGLLSLSLFSKHSINTKYSQDYYYPVGAITFLKENETSGELFSEYNWGGYLIKEYPERKVFVDGRMASWRWSAPEGELDDAYTTSLNIISGRQVDYERIFDQFNVDTVLIQVDKKEEKSFNKLVIELLGDNKLLSDSEYFGDTLIEDGWSVVYADDVSYVLRRVDDSGRRN